MPRRETDWRVLIGTGAVLILAGVYLLSDGQRAEFTLGLIAGTALVIDGIRRWVFGSRGFTGLSRDLTLVRGAVGVATGGLVVALSILQQITVVGIRIGIGVGGLAYGLLGLALAAPAIRRRQWAAMVLDVLVVVLSILQPGAFCVLAGPLSIPPAESDQSEGDAGPDEQPGGHCEEPASKSVADAATPRTVRAGATRH